MNFSPSGRTPELRRSNPFRGARGALLALAALSALGFASAQTPARVLAGSALDMRWVLYGPGLLDDVASLNPFVVRLSAPPAARYLGARYERASEEQAGAAVLAYRLRAELEDAYRFHQRQLLLQGFTELATAPGERVWAGSYQRANDIVQLQVTRGETFAYRAQLDFLGVRPGVAPGQGLTPVNPVNPIDPRQSVLLTNTPIIESRRASVRFRLPDAASEEARGSSFVLRLPPGVTRVRTPEVTDAAITGYFEAAPGPSTVLRSLGDQLIRQGFTAVQAPLQARDAVTALYRLGERTVRLTVEIGETGEVAQPYLVRLDLRPE